MDPQARPDLHDTSPVCEIGPHPQWGEPGKIVSLDPWGHRVAQDFADLIAEGIDIRPTIAITKARLTLPEIQRRDRRRPARRWTARSSTRRATSRSPRSRSIRSGGCPASPSASGSSEGALRRCLFEQTGGMYPELVTRPDLSVFLPPIGGMTLYIFGDPAFLGDEQQDPHLPGP